jgi:hypothetical protein
MKNPLQPYEIVIKEYEEAFDVYMALAPNGLCRVSGPRVSLGIGDAKAFERAQERLAIAERELLDLDAA